MRILHLSSLYPPEQVGGAELMVETLARTQAGLLRVLQERTFTPLGATTERHVDVRILVATHRDLAAEMARGAFREDLY